MNKDVLGLIVLLSLLMIVIPVVQYWQRPVR